MNKKNIVVAFVIIGITILSLCGYLIYKNKNKNLVINKGGSYNISGKHECISINTSSFVSLNLNNVKLNCETGPAINIESPNVNITLKGNNVINAKTTKDTGAINSNGSLNISGDGELILNSTYNGIVSIDKLTIDDGIYIINAVDDGIMGNSIIINNGSFKINVGADGIKSNNNLEINNGSFDIISYEDSIQSESNLSINGGIYNIVSGGGYDVEFSDGLKSKGIRAKGNIEITSGDITLNTIDDGIHSKKAITIKDGRINVQSGDDAIHADGLITIHNGSIDILNCYEGIEGSSVFINDGEIKLTSTDDGINAVGSEEEKGTVKISGGLVKVIAMGDGIDSNGPIEISGGVSYLESSNLIAEVALDHDGILLVSGGVVIAISKVYGMEDLGPQTSTQPMLIANIGSGSGEISMGDISYTPQNNEYTQVIISSSDFNVGKYTFKYGSNSKEVYLNNKVTTLGKAIYKPL